MGPDIGKHRQKNHTVMSATPKSFFLRRLCSSRFRGGRGLADRNPEWIGHNIRQPELATEFRDDGVATAFAMAIDERVDFRVYVLTVVHFSGQKVCNNCAEISRPEMEGTCDFQGKIVSAYHTGICQTGRLLDRGG